MNAPSIPHHRLDEQLLASALIAFPAYLDDDHVRAFEVIDVLDYTSRELLTIVRALEAAGRPINSGWVIERLEADRAERSGHTTGIKYHPDVDEILGLAKIALPTLPAVHRMIATVQADAAARRAQWEAANAEERAALDAEERAQAERHARAMDEMTADAPPRPADLGEDEDGDDRGDEDDRDAPEEDDHPNAPGAPEPTRQRVSAATKLVRLARACAEFWRSPDGNLFATIEISGHREHLRLASKPFRQWLAHLAYSSQQRAAGAGAVGDAITTLEGVARFEGAVHPVYTRLAAVDGGRIYIDLCDARWRAVEIDRTGWRVVDRPPVRFDRRNAMKALPEPTRGGSIAELRRHVRIADDSWPLVLGWLVGALAPRGPYPALVLRGQHGAGKSSGARRLRALIDPSIAPIRSEPREPRDLVISANASHVIALDNLSSLPPWLSDGLCRLATGGGYAARSLYTDADEIVIDVQRPVILTGITDIVTAPDLLDRALLVELEAIAPEDRETERELDARWDAAHPALLGALYDAVSMALARRDALKLARKPRLADWAQWATAAEPALGLPDGAVIDAHEGQADEATEIAIDASIIARPLIDWINARTDPVWTGTMAELRNLLTDRADLGATRDKRWPTTPRALSGQLARIAPSLLVSGVRVEKLARGSGGVRGDRGGRGWRIERIKEAV